MRRPEYGRPVPAARRVDGAAYRKRTSTLAPRLVFATDSSLAGTPAAPAFPTRPSVEETLRMILARLDDTKAEDIITIDLTGKTPIGDYMVVASGQSTRQVAAMADYIVRDLKDAGCGNARVEGLPQADWVLIDTGDIIVHLFRPEVRAFYAIEKMWTAPRRTEKRAG
jgi:ribosome-associated protein